MGGNQGGPSRPPGRSRSNKRIQELEERVAGQAKELKQIHELLGTRVDTKELLACVGRKVSVKDTCGEVLMGTLEKVGKWTITLQVEEHSFSAGGSSILFKGNLVRVTPTGVADER